MKQSVVLALTLLISACVLWPTTDRPEVTFVVKDPSNAPVAGAKVKFATYSLGMAPRSEMLEVVTSQEGVAVISGTWHWQLVILAPDGATFYDWSYCVEKSGFSAHVKNSLKTNGLRHEEAIKLIAGSARCEWKGTGGYQSHFEKVGSNNPFQPTASLHSAAAERGRYTD